MSFQKGKNLAAQHEIPIPKSHIHFLSFMKYRASIAEIPLLLARYRTSSAHSEGRGSAPYPHTLRHPKFHIAGYWGCRWDGLTVTHHWGRSSYIFFAKKNKVPQIKGLHYSSGFPTKQQQNNRTLFWRKKTTNDYIPLMNSLRPNLPRIILSDKKRVWHNFVTNGMGPLRESGGTIWASSLTSQNNKFKAAGTV